jgi:hypothetical protein
MLVWIIAQMSWNMGKILLTLLSAAVLIQISLKLIREFVFDDF